MVGATTDVRMLLFLPAAYDGLDWKWGQKVVSAAETVMPPSVPLVMDNTGEFIGISEHCLA